MIVVKTCHKTWLALVRRWHDTYAKGKTEMVLAAVGFFALLFASHIVDTLADASDTRIEKIPCQKMGSILLRDTVWSGRNFGARRQRTCLDFFSGF